MVPTGMRFEIRAALVAIKKDSFGCYCTRDTCPKHLRLGYPDPDPAAMDWIRHLWRLEELHHVGCTWRMNDLTWAQWQGLIWLTHERHWVDKEVDKVRDAVRKMEGNKPFDAAAEAAFAEGRKALGVPPMKKR